MIVGTCATHCTHSHGTDRHWDIASNSETSEAARILIWQLVVHRAAWQPNNAHHMPLAFGRVLRTRRSRRVHLPKWQPASCKSHSPAFSFLIFPLTSPFRLFSSSHSPGGLKASATSLPHLGLLAQSRLSLSDCYHTIQVSPLASPRAHLPHFWDLRKASTLRCVCHLTSHPLSTVTSLSKRSLTLTFTILTSCGPFHCSFGLPLTTLKPTFGRSPHRCPIERQC